MDIISVYIGMYADAVMEYASIYDPSAVRESVDAAQAAAGKDAARPDGERPDPSAGLIAAVNWRRKKTPEEWAARLHDRLCDIVRRGYVSQYTPAQAAALCDLIVRGVHPVCAAQEDANPMQTISVTICDGCSITADDLRRLSSDIHTAPAPDSVRDIIAAGDFRGLLDILSMSQSGFARRFGIPLRTVQNWAEGTRKPPEYILRLIAQAGGII